MPDERADERYRFADLTLDASTRRVMRGNDEIALPGLSFDLLLILARHAPRVLSTDELMTHVWKGRIVNAETVAKRVELLRQALGDDAEVPRYIAVVRGRGYRFLPEVSVVGEPSVGSSHVASDAPTESRADASHGSVRTDRTRIVLAVLGASVVAAILGWSVLRDTPGDTSPSARVGAPDEAASIAVLPFLNLSDDPSNVWLSDGMTEELIGSLTKIPNLRVVSRTSSFAFRHSEAPLGEIARTLNVNHLLEGSVRKVGDRIRVTVQLIDVRSDSHLWSENFDRRFEDVLAIQQEIADHVAEALHVRLSSRTSPLGEVSTHDVEAYQLYLQGVHVWNLRGEQNVRQGVRILTHAVELDPEFARAHAALGIALTSAIYWYSEPEPDLLERAERVARRAMTLDPTLAQPYVVFAVIALLDGDWRAAEAHYRRALELNPNEPLVKFWMGEMYSFAGRTTDALQLALGSLERDPISIGVLHDVANLYLRDHRFDLACPYVERGLRLGSNPYVHLQAAQCHEHRGDLEAMRESVITAERMFGFERPVYQLVQRAVAEPRARSAALEAIKHEAERGTAILARSYRALGEYDAVFDMIQSGWRLKRKEHAALRDLWDVEARGLRAHPRFRELVEEVGLLEFWRKSGWPDVCRPAGDSFVCD